MKTKHFFLLTALGVVSALPLFAQKKADYNVVPKPMSIESKAHASAFRLNAQTVIVATNKQEKRNAQFLQEYIAQRTGLNLRIVNKASAGNAILLQTNYGHTNPEAYALTVEADRIVIYGATTAGTFYGIQTLRKALPNLQKGERNAETWIELPATTIHDAPRFGYRGAHLDASRHFATIDSVRRYIDMLALHNINRFHWHLTDDQGWRIEIKGHPRLTEIGSYRSETVIGRNTGKYDGKPHSGYYTRKECMDLVKYAAERNITIIPEIDLPGHMQGALAAYPELGCTGGPYEVWKMWGVSDEVLCAGNPKVYRFLEEVLDDVVKIFPSKYIHIGGDECPKERWKTCPKCQAKIAEEGLHADGQHTAEERLQSYVIRFAEAHLAKRGRRIIGWDEILEGGLAPTATVMSWRGEAGGLEAVRSGHDAIMTPNTYLYFDYYQTKNIDSEPLAIGGFLPLERVYEYEPVPAGLTAEEAARITGVQANLWREYIPTYSHVEYMVLPRMAALAEVQWCAKGKKDYNAFVKRLVPLMKLYDEQGYNYAKHVFNVNASYSHDAQRGILAHLWTFDNAPIRYTLDGSTPFFNSPRYDGPIAINADAQLRFAAFRSTVTPEEGFTMEKQERGYVDGEDFSFNLATAKPIQLLQGVNPQYKFGGASTLVDGLQGKDTNFQTARWIGFNNESMEAVIDFGVPTAMQQVAFNTCVEKGSWIYDVRKVVISVSDDGVNFQNVVEKNYPALTEADENGIKTHSFELPAGTTARYLKVLAVPETSIPDWHTVAKGKRGFLFVDEIVVK